MKINAVVATRMTSTRLPGKVLMPLADRPALALLIERLRRSKYIDNVIIATTTNREDDAVVEVAEREQAIFYRGSEEDVLLRTVEAAEACETDYIVQVTSDCPLIDAETIDAVIERMVTHPFLDYVGNHLVRTYPLGFSAEIFRTEELRKVEQISKDDAAVREHVSLYFYEHPELYHLSNIEAPAFLRHPEYRLTLDTLEDYQVIHEIYAALYPQNPDFNLYDIIRFLQCHPDIVEMNGNIKQKKAR